MSKDWRFYAGIGSRRLSKSELVFCHNTGTIMAALGWDLVTGAAQGADQAFAEGALAVGGRVVLCLPWASYEQAWVLKARAKGALVRVLKDSDVDAYASLKLHPAASRLSDAAKKLHARNHLIVHKAELVVAFPKANQQGGLGGTGQGLRIAKDLGIRAVGFGNPEDLKLARKALSDHDLEKVERVAAARGEEYSKTVARVKKAEA